MTLTYGVVSYAFMTRDINRTVENNTVGSSYTYKTTFTGSMVKNTLIGTQTRIHKITGYINCNINYRALIEFLRANVGLTVTIVDDDLTIVGVLLNPNTAVVTASKNFYKLDLEVLECLS